MTAERPPSSSERHPAKAGKAPRGFALAVGHDALLNGGVILLVLVTIVSVTMTLHQFREQAEARVAMRTQTLAKTIEQTLEGLIDTIDIALLASSNEIARQIATGEVDRAAVTAMLIEHRRQITHVAHFRATDERGDILYGPDVPLPAVNTSDRDYFLTLRSGAQSGLVADKPFLGRVSGTWVWTFARRIDKPDGSFGGVVFAAVSIAEIERKLAELRVEPGTSMSLRDAEARFVVRYPPASAEGFPIGEKRLSQRLLEAMSADAQQGTYSVDSARVDGEPRTYSYARSAKYGFLVNVGIEHAAAFAETNRQVWIVGGVATAFVLALLAFWSLIRRAWQRGEAALGSLEEAQQIANLGQYEFDLRTQRWSASPIFDAICGIDAAYPRDAEHWARLAAPECRAERRAQVKRAIRDGSPFDLEYRLVRPVDGEERWVSSKGRVHRADDGTPLAIVGTMQDVTERKRAEDDLRIAASAFDTQESMAITDHNSVILRVNRAFTETTGYSAEEAIGQTPRILKSSRHDAEFFRQMWNSITRTGGWQGEIWDRRKDGDEYPKWLTISAVRNATGEVTHYIGTHFDITERKRAEEKINELAFYDQLTGLPNRTLLLDRMRQAISASARSSRHGAILFVDLDNFKKLNDTLGHGMGDELLRQAGNRLIGCVRGSDTVARLGGDEFVLVLTNLDVRQDEAAAQAEAIGGMVVTTLNEPYLLGTTVYHSTPSVGIKVFFGQDYEVDVLLKQADLAMYKAKDEGRNGLRFFDPEMEITVMRRAGLENDLRQALDRDEFVLHYQAQVGDDGIVGAEVLLRWQHPQRGLVSPGEFVPLAEETGLIIPLGAWVLSAACHCLAAWSGRPGFADLTIAVNVSAQQLRQNDFVDQVLAVLDASGANAGRLKLELTESMLVADVDAVIAKMIALKARGVGFSLDDFGTGFSSLSYLKRLPIDQLKIDQSFVRDLTVDSNDATIARTIITLAHSLDLDVIAEGVETEAQRQFLASAGCACYQGYLFGRPVPRADFEVLVERRSMATA